ncbi:MAG: magnesium transporter CorA family protein [Minisyncoccota bacterium]
MISRYAYRDRVWIDLERPTAEEVHRIAQEFSISERLETELISPTPSPLVASDAGTTFLVLHFPTHGAADGEIRDQEVDFIIGDTFIITARYEVIAPIHRLRKVLEAQQLISPQYALTTDVLLEILFAHLYTAVRDHIHDSTHRLTHIERDMFNGFERHTVRLISNASREFLHIEASLANQEEPLVRFLKALSVRGSFGASFPDRAERILAERAQAARLVKTYRAVATELRETNASLLEARQNEIMKTLTVITFSMLPLELIALIFSMHALGTPLEQNPNAFWIILALMLGTGGLMMLFFARRRWFS